MRSSSPQLRWTGAQKFSTSRLYELIVGARRGMMSGKASSRPAKKCRPRSVNPAVSEGLDVPVSVSASSLANRLWPLLMSQREMWM